jgi:hypothetical protein
LYAAVAQRGAAGATQSRIQNHIEPIKLVLAYYKREIVVLKGEETPK